MSDDSEIRVLKRGNASGTGADCQREVVVEIGGVKMIVDLSKAKPLNRFKVGDNVKILKKQYSDTFKSHPGVICGFDNYQQLPTIVVAYMTNEYGAANIEFAYINANSKDIEICHMNTAERILKRADAVDAFDREIQKKELELMEIRSRKEYFLKNFVAHFQKEEGI